MKNIYNGNQTKAAEALASFAGLAGVIEFALNPLLGRLSDRHSFMRFVDNRTYGIEEENNLKEMILKMIALIDTELKLTHD